MSDIISFIEETQSRHGELVNTSKYKLIVIEIRNLITFSELLTPLTTRTFILYESCLSECQKC